MLPLTAYAVPAVVSGGGWYLKNLLVYGNPVYPFAGVGLPGRTGVSGLLTSPPGPSLPEPVPTLWSWAHDLIPQAAYSYEHRAGGLGAVFIWAGLPCLLFIIVRTVRTRDLPWAVLLL